MVFSGTHLVQWLLVESATVELDQCPISKNIIFSVDANTRRHHNEAEIPVELVICFFPIFALCDNSLALVYFLLLILCQPFGYALFCRFLLCEKSCDVILGRNSLILKVSGSKIMVESCRLT
jgi:hypothetical protein